MIRLYRVLLLAYPRDLRDRHGAEMTAAFAERWRAEGRGVWPRARLMTLLITDFTTSLLREWRVAFGAGRQTRPRPGTRLPMTDLFVDLRLALRHLARTPIFTVGAIVTLGLGVGATTAIFSLAEATLLRPMPITDADRILQSQWSWSLPDFRDLESDREVFSHVAAWTGLDFGMDRDGVTAAVPGLAVSGGFFGLTNLQPALGRLLNESDDQAGAAATVVLSHRFWQSDFGQRPEVIGRSINLNQRPVTVVGVAPVGFRGFSLRESAEVFVSLSAVPQLAAGFLARPQLQTSRNSVWLQIGGRLADGVPPETARARTEQIYRRGHPPDAESTRIPEPVVLVPVTALALGLDSSDDLRRLLYVLMAATIVTLLLACASVASLQLVRTHSRRREFAIRAALGGGRVRLMRLLLTESLVLGLGGAAAGVGGAKLMLALLATFRLPGNIVIGDLDVVVSASLLAISGGLGVLTSVIFGLAPMWQASSVPARAALRDQARGSSRRPVRAVLVGAQVSVCVVLLGGSLAFGRAIQQAVGLDLGFDVTDTAMVSVDPALARRTTDDTMQFHRRTLELARAHPMVSSAAWAALPAFERVIVWEVAVPGYDAQGSDDILDRAVETNLISDGYFETLGIPFIEGRGFSSADETGAARVAIVSKSMADKYWPGESPVGRQLFTDLSLEDPEQAHTVVGVVADIQRGLAREQAPTMYLVTVQHPEMDFGGHYLFVRAEDGATGAAVAAATAAVTRADPAMPVSRVATLEDAFGDTLMAQRLGLTLFLLFAGLAMALTGLGLYAVVAYAVTLRRREIGIRVALGATGASVVGLITRQGLLPVAVGLAAGAGVLGLTAPAIERFMYAAAPLDARSVLALGGAILVLAAAAMFVPARRALGIAPSVALRGD